MQYTLLNVITTNARFTSNQDGTITVTGVVVKVGIVGAPADKFVQTEIIPSTGTNAFPIILPANGTNSDNQKYIQTEAQAYVTKTYPNT